MSVSESDDAATRPAEHTGLDTPRFYVEVPGGCITVDPSRPYPRPEGTSVRDKNDVVTETVVTPQTVLDGLAAAFDKAREIPIPANRNGVATNFNPQKAAIIVSRLSMQDDLPMIHLADATTGEEVGVYNIREIGSKAIDAVFNPYDSKILGKSNRVRASRKKVGAWNEAQLKTAITAFQIARMDTANFAISIDEINDVIARHNPASKPAAAKAKAAVG